MIPEETSEFYLYYSAGRARIGPSAGSLNSWIFSEFLGLQPRHSTLGTRWFSRDKDGEIVEAPVRIIELGKPISFTIKYNIEIEEIIPSFEREYVSKKLSYLHSRVDQFCSFYALKFLLLRRFYSFNKIKL